MPKQSARPNLDMLSKQLETHGWDLDTGSDAFTLKNRTLKELLQFTHDRHKKGQTPGLISNIENEIELDLVEIQNLWAQLGLPL